MRCWQIRGIKGTRAKRSSTRGRVEKAGMEMQRQSKALRKGERWLHCTALHRIAWSKSKTNQISVQHPAGGTSKSNCTLPILHVPHVGSSFLPSTPLLLATPGRAPHPHTLPVQKGSRFPLNPEDITLLTHSETAGRSDCTPSYMYVGGAAKRSRDTYTRPARVEPEPPPSKKPEPRTTRVAVVYYLCRNHQLEHPHFMQVPLASTQGLYLRDVISRLDALRGKGMAAKYSWSCKRRYKNGFVWHDLSEGDLLLPAQGAEYVLKGSELQLDQLAPDHQQNSTTSTSNAKVVQRQQELPHSPAVPVIKKEAVPPQQISSASTIGYDEQCRVPHSGSSSDSSPKTSSPSSGSSSPGQNNPAAAHHVATQTDDKARGDNTKPQRGQVAAVVITPAERPEIVDESHSKHHRPAAGEYPRSSRRSGTLQSLIRAEAAGRRRDLLVLELEDDDDDDDERRRATTGSVSARLKPANLLARLMACGANNQSFGFVQASYKPRRFAQQLEYPYSSSPELFPLGVLKPGATSVSTARASDTENSTGSLHDGATCKLKRSSSSSSLRHEDGVSEEGHSSEGDPVNLCIGTSKRMSGPSSGKVSSFEGGAVPR